MGGKEEKEGEGGKLKNKFSKMIFLKINQSI